MNSNRNTATYSYLANSSLVGQIAYVHAGTTALTTTNQYDYLNRLTSKSSAPAIGSQLRFNYNYNSANQRTMDRLGDNSVWRYQYDSLGQVTAGQKFWSDGTAVAGQQFDYAFDTIGNRTQTQTGSDATGANLRVANYTNNSLNQITSRGVPGYVDIMGDALATNSVTVNGVTPYQKGEYFREQLAVTNASAAVWDGITVASTGQTSITGNEYVPQSPESYTYDLDGNLLSDGRWNYVWDGENRLVSMTSLSGAPSGSKFQLNFTYDYMGRRIEKTVSTNNGSSYVSEYTNVFAYDTWNCLAIINPSFGLMTSCMWGSDLSGSLQGAGGVGGLLATSTHNNGGTMTNCFVAYDGNGNVCGLIKASNGTNEATYEYGPFGELIRASGPLAKANPFRFSTKYDDDESGLMYYGYRYCDPSTGRWLSRDVLETQPGYESRYQLLRSLGWHDDLAEAIASRSPDGNVYICARNSPPTGFDSFGLACITQWSSSGTFNGNFWGHNAGGGPPSSLTFTLCCPKCMPNLFTYSVTSTQPPPSGQTQHGHIFPNDWTTVSISSYSTPSAACYTIVINVTSTATVNDWFGFSTFITSVNIKGSCCNEQGPPARVDPPRPTPGTSG